MVDVTPMCWMCGREIGDDAPRLAAREEMVFPSLTASRGTLFCGECATALALEEVERFLREGDPSEGDPQEPGREPGQLQERCERVYRACRAEPAPVKELRIRTRRP